MFSSSLAVNGLQTNFVSIRDSLATPTSRSRGAPIADVKLWTAATARSSVASPGGHPSASATGSRLPTAAAAVKRIGCGRSNASTTPLATDDLGPAACESAWARPPPT